MRLGPKNGPEYEKPIKSRVSGRKMDHFGHFMSFGGLLRPISGPYRGLWLDGPGRGLGRDLLNLLSNFGE